LAGCSPRAATGDASDWIFTRHDPDGSEYLVVALGKGLREAGLIEGQNFTIEFGWGEGHRERLPALAAGFVRRPVSVIVASATSAVIAAQALTTTVPIVFVFPGDPVELKLVASINRPGGNVTGVSYLNTELAGKRLGLLHELVARDALLGILVNSKGVNAKATIQDVEKVALVIGARIHIVSASSEREIEEAFGALREKRAAGLLIGNDSFFTTRREQISALAAHHGFPAIYAQREFAEGGGLMSYGADLPDAYRFAGLYAGRILKGAKPSDLPVLQPTKFELVINLKTARALGLDIPAKVLALADEVIE
jgi:putative ABC transport system substrate-binding protein